MSAWNDPPTVIFRELSVDPIRHLVETVVVEPFPLHVELVPSTQVVKVDLQVPLVSEVRQEPKLVRATYLKV